MTVRILVTGSRTWTDRTRIARSIMAVINRTCPMLTTPEGNPYRRDLSGVTVVHGACPDGADALAQDVCDHLGIATERWPADWRTHKRAAGLLRNIQMVRSEPDVCLAFVMACHDPKCTNPEPHGTHGTVHCLNFAEQAGVPTFRWGWTKAEP